MPPSEQLKGQEALDLQAQSLYFPRKRFPNKLTNMAYVEIATTIKYVFHASGT